MTDNKTRQTEASVADFIAAVEPGQRRKDAGVIRAMMERISGHPPRMWGPSIIGFGSCHYKYDSGREGDMPIVGFSPRRSSLVLYVGGGRKQRPDLMDKLGKHKSSKACLYVNKLADIDLAVLEELIEVDVAHTRNRYDAA